MSSHSTNKRDKNRKEKNDNMKIAPIEYSSQLQNKSVLSTKCFLINCFIYFIFKYSFNHNNQFDFNFIVEQLQQLQTLQQRVVVQRPLQLAQERLVQHQNH